MLGNDLEALQLVPSWLLKTDHWPVHPRWGCADSNLLEAGLDLSTQRRPQLRDTEWIVWVADFNDEFQHPTEGLQKLLVAEEVLVSAMKLNRLHGEGVVFAVRLVKVRLSFIHTFDRVPQPPFGRPWINHARREEVLKVVDRVCNVISEVHNRGFQGLLARIWCVTKHGASNPPELSFLGGVGAEFIAIGSP